MEFIKNWSGYYNKSSKEQVLTESTYNEMLPEQKLFQAMKNNWHTAPPQFIKQLLTQPDNDNLSQFLHNNINIINCFYKNDEIFELLLPKIKVNNLHAIIKYHRHDAFINNKFYRIIKLLSDDLDMIKNPKLDLGINLLLNAITNNDVKSGELLLDLGHKLSCNEISYSIQYFYKIHPDIIKRIIDRCSDICNNEIDLLYIVCENLGHVSQNDVSYYENIIKLIVEKIEYKKLISGDSLLLICKYGSTELIKMMISYENVNNECTHILYEMGTFIGSKYTLLHYACYVNNIELIKILMDAGANPNAPNNLGYTPNTFRKVFGLSELTI